MDADPRRERPFVRIVLWCTVLVGLLAVGEHANSISVKYKSTPTNKISFFKKKGEMAI